MEEGADGAVAAGACATAIPGPSEETEDGQCGRSHVRPPYLINAGYSWRSRRVNRPDVPNDPRAKIPGPGTHGVRTCDRMIIQHLHESGRYVLKHAIQVPALGRILDKHPTVTVRTCFAALSPTDRRSAENQERICTFATWPHSQADALLTMDRPARSGGAFQLGKSLRSDPWASRACRPHRANPECEPRASPTHHASRLTSMRRISASTKLRRPAFVVHLHLDQSRPIKARSSLRLSGALNKPS